MTEDQETRGLAELDDSSFVSEKTTFFGGAVFFMVCLIAIFANLAFGGTSTAILGIISILIGLLVVFWLLDSWRRKEITISTNYLLLPFLALIFVGIIQLLPLSSPEIPAGVLQTSVVKALSLDPYSTRLAILKLIIFFIFFAASLTFINSQKRLRRTVVTIVVFASIMAFFGVIQRLGNPDYIYGFREVGQAIPFASYINQHHFAAFLEMTIGLSLGLLLGGGTKNDKFLLLGIAVLLMGIGIVFTGSRGGLISLIGVIGFLVLINIIYGKPTASDDEYEADKKPNALIRNLTLLGGGALLIVVILVAVAYLGGGESVLRGTGINAEQADFTSGRWHFWNVTMQIVKDNPIIGAGLESFGVAFTKHDSWNGQFRVEQAHNDYLQVLADSGIVGLLCVFAFLAIFFKQSLNTINKSSDTFRKNTAIGAMAGCFGLLIHSLFDFPLRTNANMFFFLILVTLAVVTINQPKLYRKRVKIKIQ